MSAASSLQLNSLNPASIKNLLDNSSVHVNWKGTRSVSGVYGSIQLDSIIERLETISNQRFISKDDQKNGHECVKKIRCLYKQSDWHLFAILPNMYDTFSQIVRIFKFPLVLVGIYPHYSLRERIDVKASQIYTTGPNNISSNFKNHFNGPFFA